MIDEDGESQVALGLVLPTVPAMTAETLMVGGGVPRRTGATAVARVVLLVVAPTRFISSATRPEGFFAEILRKKVRTGS